MRTILLAVAAVAMALLIARAAPGSAATLSDEADESLYFPAKLKVLRATVRHGTLEALLSITGRATGALTIDYQAASQFQRSSVAVGPAQEGEKRVAVSQPLAGRQRAVQTGIINATFAGDATTQPDSTRLRAANGRSGLILDRLTFADGRLGVSGSINRRVSGIVRLRASYLDLDGSTGLWNGRAAVIDGTWALNEKLPAAVTFDPNAYLTIQFTGQKDAPGGPFRGDQIGKSLGNLADVTFTPPIAVDGQQTPSTADTCAGSGEDGCTDSDGQPD